MNIEPIEIKRKKEKLNHQGFALVVTLILTSVMLTIVTLASKEMVDEMRNSARLDNSLIAYYAAEAGIEDALLQLRYNKNAEIAEKCWEVSSHTEKIGKCVSNAYEKNHYYKLEASNKSSTSTTTKIYKDDVYEIPVTENSYTPTWTYNNLGATGIMKVEVTSYADSGEILDKKLVTSPTNSTTINTTCVTCTKKIVRIRPWYTTGTSSSPYIELAISSGSNSGTTTINSTGYYGNVARKIIAKIDTTSGSVTSIFDFAIYSDTALIK